MVKRHFYTKEDNYYEEYLVTKCPVFNNIYIGSIDCEKCKKYVKTHESFENDDDGSNYVICKN